MTFHSKIYLSHVLKKNHHVIEDVIQDKFLNFLALLSQWNKVFNLTNICDPRGMILLHILDSLSINPYIKGNNILDVGSGAGLPGIPIALCQPEKHFVLIDSNNKKIKFIRQALLELNITNIEAIHGRVEDFHSSQCFDTILSRAFASLQTMLLTTAHLICPTGIFLAMKGVYPKTEIEEIPQQFKLLNVQRLKIEDLDAERHLVSMEKRN